MTPQEFRERNRDYGVRVPPGEVEHHLANGWTIVSDEEDRSETVLMRPPSRDTEAAA